MHIGLFVHCIGAPGPRKMKKYEWSLMSIACHRIKSQAQSTSQSGIFCAFSDKTMANCRITQGPIFCGQRRHRNKWAQMAADD